MNVYDKQTTARKTIARRLLLGVLAALLVVATFIPLAFAGSFSYEGYAIRDKASVGSGYISSATTATVYHNQTKNHVVNYGMTVSVQKQNWWGGWDTVNSHTFYDTTSGSFSTWCEPGTYRLYFLTTNYSYTMDIYGSFNW